MHVPEDKLEEYRRIMAVARGWDSEGSKRSGQGDYEGANQAWKNAAAKRAEAQKLRVPGREPDESPIQETE